MTFIWLHWWWLVAALPCALFLLWTGVRGRRRRLERFAHPRRHADLLDRVDPGRRSLRAWLAVAALALAVLAALGPTYGYTLRQVKHRGVDMLFLLDLSKSMLAADLKPDRLERARRDIKGLLRRLGGERVGLVAFSGTSHLICPLTHDYAAFESFLARANTHLPRVGGTDLGKGLLKALEALGEGQESHQAIIILSDGEDLGGEWAKAVAAARERSVRVYAVGYGTPVGAKITVEVGGKQVFLKGPKGQEVITRLVEDTLSKVAVESGGDYLRANAHPLPLDEILEKRIKVIEQREYEESERRVPWNRFQWPLALAVVLLLVRALLSERRRELMP